MSDNYTSVSKLINELTNAGLINESTDKQLNVLFDDFRENKAFPTNWTVEILGMEIVNEFNEKRKITYKEYIEAVGGIVQYLNVGKQVNKEMKSLPLVKEPHILMVQIKKTTNNTKFPYHKLRLSNAKITGYNNLKSERSKAKVERVNSLAAGVDESDDDEWIE